MRFWYNDVSEWRTRYVVNGQVSLATNRSAGSRSAVQKLLSTEIIPPSILISYVRDTLPFASRATGLSSAFLARLFAANFINFARRSVISRARVCASRVISKTLVWKISRVQDRDIMCDHNE